VSGQRTQLAQNRSRESIERRYRSHHPVTIVATDYCD
jgi:hypothetical protein